MTYADEVSAALAALIPANGYTLPVSVTEEYAPSPELAGFPEGLNATAQVVVVWTENGRAALNRGNDSRDITFEIGIRRCQRLGRVDAVRPTHE